MIKYVVLLLFTGKNLRVVMDLMEGSHQQWVTSFGPRLWVAKDFPFPSSHILSLEVDQAALLEPANSQEVAVWKWGIPVQIPQVSKIYVMLDN